MVELNMTKVNSLLCEREIINQIGLVAFLAGYPGNVARAIKEKKEKTACDDSLTTVFCKHERWTRGVYAS